MKKRDALPPTDIQRRICADLCIPISVHATRADVEELIKKYETYEDLLDQQKDDA